MGWDNLEIRAGGWNPANLTPAPKMDWEGDVTESRAIKVEEPDEIIPSEAIVGREAPNVVTSHVITDEQLEVLHLSLIHI